MWINDLSRERELGELQPDEMWFGDVNYFWPES
jgi:hypothetical protein